VRYFRQHPVPIGFILQDLHPILSRPRYEANCQGALTMPEAYWSLLGAQLCRKTEFNKEGYGKALRKLGFS
jgi:hypothetical protein